MMTLRIGLAAVVVLGTLLAQKYNGPTPAKADVPYLIHADSLVETETVDAKEETTPRS